MTTPDIVAAIGPVVEAFERLDIPYRIGGSLASSAHGVARATLDVDVVADIPRGRIDDLVHELGAEYYVDADAISDALERRSMFNLVHLPTMLKVGVYLLGTRPFDRESFGRRSAIGFSEAEDGRQLFFATPEDVVLHKLEWFRLGGELSQRQWGDVVGVLRIQSGALDVAYLRRWAAELKVLDLLERAVAEAGTAGE